MRKGEIIIFVYEDEYLNIDKKEILGLKGNRAIIKKIQEAIIAKNGVNIAALPTSKNTQTLYNYLLEKFSKTEQEIMTSLRGVGLEKQKNIPINRLSIDEIKRFMIAYCEQAKPQIVIVEEPREGLDNVGKDVFLTLLIKLNEEGQAMIFVTRDMYYLKWCDRVIEV